MASLTEEATAVTVATLPTIEDLTTERLAQVIDRPDDGNDIDDECHWCSAERFIETAAGNLACAHCMALHGTWPGEQ